MEAKIEQETRLEQNEKEVVFRAELGPRYEDVTVEFEGASPLLKERLEEELGRDKLAARVHTSLQQVDDQIKRLYRSEGYLQAEVGAPVPRLDPSTRTAVLVLPIKEGPRAELTQIEFDGNSVHGDEDLARHSQLTVGQVFRPADRDAAVVRLRLLYAAEGYNDTVITPETQSDPETGKVRLAFRIEENRREVVRAIEVKGQRENERTFCHEPAGPGGRGPFHPGEGRPFSPRAVQHGRLFSCGSGNRGDRAGGRVAGRKTSARDSAGAGGQAVSAAVRRLLRH